MIAKLDGLVAEIVRAFDSDYLLDDDNLKTLWQPNRTHFILAALVRCDLARVEKSGDMRRWRPSRRLEKLPGVKRHGIADEIERVEAPIAISTLADDVDAFLRANHDVVEDVAFCVVRHVQMCALGVLEYRGKKDGRCQFCRSGKSIQVVDESGNTHDFVDRFL
jgi:hypothetical protein